MMKALLVIVALVLCLPFVFSASVYLTDTPTINLNETDPFFSTQNNSLARIGNCSAGQFMTGSSSASTGVVCAVATIVDENNYTTNVMLYGNDTRNLNVTISRTGLPDISSNIVLPVDQSNYTTDVQLAGNNSRNLSIIMSRVGLPNISSSLFIPADENNYVDNVYCNGNETSNFVCSLSPYGLGDVGFSFTIGNGSINVLEDWLVSIGNWSFDKPGIQQNITSLDTYAQNKITNGTISFAGYGSSNVTEAYVNNKITNGTLPPDQNNYTTDVSCDGNGTTNYVCNLVIAGRSNISFTIVGYNLSLAGLGSSNVTEAYVQNKITNGTIMDASTRVLNSTFESVGNWTADRGGIQANITAVDTYAQNKVTNGTISFAGYGSSNVTEAYVQNKITNGTISFAGYGSSNVTEAYVQNKLTNGTALQNGTTANLLDLNITGKLNVAGDINSSQIFINGTAVTGNINGTSINVLTLNASYGANFGMTGSNNVIYPLNVSGIMLLNGVDINQTIVALDTYAQNKMTNGSLPAGVVTGSGVIGNLALWNSTSSLNSSGISAEVSDYPGVQFGSGGSITNQTGALYIVPTVNATFTKAVYILGDLDATQILINGTPIGSGFASDRVMNTTYDASELAQNTSFDLKVETRVLNSTFESVGNWSADKGGIQANITAVDTYAQNKITNGTISFAGYGSSNVTEAYVQNKITNGTISFAGYGSSNVTEEYVQNKMTNGTIPPGMGSSNVTEAYVNNKITNGTLPPDQNNYTTDVSCDGNGTTNYVCNMAINGMSNISFTILGYNVSLAGLGSSNVTEAYVNNKITNGTISFAGYGSSNVTEAYVNNKVTNGTISFAGYGSSNVTEAYVNNKMTNGTIPPGMGSSNVTEAYVQNKMTNGTIPPGMGNSNVTEAYVNNKVTNGTTIDNYSSANLLTLEVLHSAQFYRNDSNPTAPLLYIWQERDNDTQQALKVEQLGTGNALFVIGSSRFDGGVTINGAAMNVNATTNISRGLNIGTKGTDNVITSMNVSGKANFSGEVSVYDEKNNSRRLGNLVTHVEEFETNTLLDKSRGTLYVQGAGLLNFTLYAFYGNGEWNFNGTVYGGASAVGSASIILLNGTNQTPKTNNVHFYLDGSTPVLTTTEAYPSYNHIDVATFIVGDVSDRTANIYSYNRNRYEIDSFVTRSLERWQYMGTLYKSGFNTTSCADCQQKVNISTGEFFNNLFEMTTTNAVQSREFYFINASGNFTQCTQLAGCVTQYNDGTLFTGVNERVNLVWGIVPVNTTGGVGPTVARLVVALPNYPGAGNTYQSVSNAIQDNFATISYFPGNNNVKQVFTPIARTIYRPSTAVLEPFATGVYHRFIAGTISSGGASPSGGTTNHAVLDNLDYSNAGHTGFGTSNVSEAYVQNKVTNGTISFAGYGSSNVTEAYANNKVTNGTAYLIAQIDLRTGGMNTTVTNEHTYAQNKITNGTLPPDQNNYTTGFEITGNGSNSHTWILNRTGLTILQGTFTETSHAGYGSSNVTEAYVNNKITNGTLPVDQNNYTTGFSIDGNGTTTHTIQFNITGRSPLNGIFTEASHAGFGSSNVTEAYVNNKITNGTVSFAGYGTSNVTEAYVNNKITNGTLPPDQNNYTTGFEVTGNGTTSLVWIMNRTGLTQLRGTFTTISTAGFGTSNVTEAYANNKMTNGTIPPGMGSSNVTEAYVNNKVTNGTISFAGYGSSNVTEAYVNNKVTNGTLMANGSSANFLTLNISTGASVGTTGTANVIRVLNITGNVFISGTQNISSGLSIGTNGTANVIQPLNISGKSFFSGNIAVSGDIDARQVLVNGTPVTGNVNGTSINALTMNASYGINLGTNGTSNVIQPLNVSGFSWFERDINAHQILINGTALSTSGGSVNGTSINVTKVMFTTNSDHQIYDNSTCTVIKGSTGTFAVC